jgi:hypothetical protein
VCSWGWVNIINVNISIVQEKKICLLLSLVFLTWPSGLYWLVVFVQDLLHPVIVH